MAGQFEYLPSEGIIGEWRGDGRMIESLGDFLLHEMLKIILIMMDIIMLGFMEESRDGLYG